MRLLEIYAVGLLPVAALLGAGYWMNRWVFGKEWAHEMLKDSWGASLLLGGTLVFAIIVGVLGILAIPLFLGIAMLDN